eukprot:04686.XXX_255247_255696_1 [CDS] Oithona nana genome sequencing.
MKLQVNFSFVVFFLPQPLDGLTNFLILLEAFLDFCFFNFVTFFLSIFDGFLSINLPLTFSINSSGLSTANSKSFSTTGGTNVVIFPMTAAGVVTSIFDFLFGCLNSRSSNSEGFSTLVNLGSNFISGFALRNLSNSGFDLILLPIGLIK